MNMPVGKEFPVPNQTFYTILILNYVTLLHLLLGIIFQDHRINLVMYSLQELIFFLLDIRQIKMAFY